MDSHQQSLIDQKVSAPLWKAIGGLGFIGSLALASAVSSEKVGPDVLKLIDSNPYAVTLFGIPLLSGVLIAIAIIGRVHAVATRSRKNWSARIPPIVDSLSESSLRVPVNSVILAAFLLVPWFSLGVVNRKFFEGTYYYASDANRGCDEKNMSGSCETMGSGWKHFAPKYGIGSLTNTHYRYEGNKSYVPIATPLVDIGLSLAASVLCLRLLVSLFAPARN